MKVYETGEFCAHQRVWIGDEYENEGHGVDADGDPESDDVSMYDFRSREEAIKHASRALASMSADRSHERDIARLVLRSIGEEDRAEVARVHRRLRRRLAGRPEEVTE